MSQREQDDARSNSISREIEETLTIIAEQLIISARHNCSDDAKLTADAKQMLSAVAETLAESAATRLGNDLWGCVSRLMAENIRLTTEVSKLTNPGIHHIPAVRQAQKSVH